MPLESSKNDRDIQFIYSVPKMRPTALKMAKNQGLDSACQNKKIKIKNFARRQRRDVLAYTGMPLYSKGVRFRRSCPLPIRTFLWRIAARLADGPTDRHQRPPTDRRRAAANTGDHWRPTATSGPTDKGPTLAARLAAVPVTSDTAGHRPRASIQSQGPPAKGQRQGLAERG